MSPDLREAIRLWLLADSMVSAEEEQRLHEFFSEPIATPSDCSKILPAAEILNDPKN